MAQTTKEKLLRIHSVTGRNTAHQMAEAVLEVHAAQEKHDDIIRKLVRRIAVLEDKIKNAPAKTENPLTNTVL